MASCNSEPSLQDAFANFRKRRQADRRKVQELQSKAPKSQEGKEQLRQRFLGRVKSYLGVPYSKKYHQDPASEHYGAPLYLDCCGLVRRAARDLADEFGFLIGKWNQAYQFDTLPIELTQETMQPGDLVFISGDYFNEKSKPQKHKMVHIEVWLGEGTRTVGARHQTGVVQVHDSYQFVSKTYQNMQYHFRSLDTWLDGTCQSHCSEHEWKLPDPKDGSKYSLFNADQDQDADADQEQDGDSQQAAPSAD